MSTKFSHGLWKKPYESASKTKMWLLSLFKLSKLVFSTAESLNEYVLVRSKYCFTLSRKENKGDGRTPWLVFISITCNFCLIAYFKRSTSDVNGFLGEDGRVNHTPNFTSLQNSTKTRVKSFFKRPKPTWTWRQENTRAVKLWNLESRLTTGGALYLCLVSKV